MLMHNLKLAVAIFECLYASKVTTRVMISHILGVMINGRHFLSVISHILGVKTLNLFPGRRTRLNIDSQIYFEKADLSEV